jgi:hypothetical protein
MESPLPMSWTSHRLRDLPRGLSNTKRLSLNDRSDTTVCSSSSGGLL